ncbi:MAG: MHYT domain-containing protein [Aestuariivirga sp.]
MELHFGLPHDPWFVALSVVMAIFGGYVGLGLAGQARTANGLYRRGLLAGAAWSLGLGIWTMHFVGMLAAQLPAGTLFSILLTLLSFLLCVLVVGIAAFVVSRGASNRMWAALAAVVMGSGIVSMHYIGMHAITGPYMLHHDVRYIVAAAAIAVTSSYGALRIFESELKHRTLALSALIFGLAVSGMHYTAMMGTMIVPSATMAGVFGPAVSSDILMIVVALLAFVISGVFLLYLVPERTRVTENIIILTSEPRGPPAPQQRAALVPIESEGATNFMPADEICAIQATTHYTLIYDGRREHFSPWSITEAEERLDKSDFMRVHRSHLIAIDKVRALRKSGDGAVVEVGSLPRIVPVSRNHYAELKSRLGLHLKVRLHGTSQQKV